VDVPGTDDPFVPRGALEEEAFRFRVPLLVLYAAVLVAVFWAGGREDSDLGVLTVPSFAFAFLVGFLSPWIAPLLPPVALAVAIGIGSATGGSDNEYGGLKFVGGLVISEICIAIGMWNRRRRRLAEERWRRTQQA
jgi:peptidoglycan/LPS O-acetylase OafA/YrhL